MGRENGKPAVKVLPAALTHPALRELLTGYEFWTERGYDVVRGEYVYTLSIVLATGEAAILDD